MKTSDSLFTCATNDWICYYVKFALYELQAFKSDVIRIGLL